MEKIEVVARRWGDSIAVIIPKKIVESERISPKSKIKIKIEKEDDLSELFGKFKTKKSAQELKNEGREGWE